MTARCVLYYNTILARGTCRPRCIPLHTGASRHRTFLRRTGELGRSPMNRRRWGSGGGRQPLAGRACTRDAQGITGGGSLRAAPHNTPMTKGTSLPSGTLDQGGEPLRSPLYPRDQPCGLDTASVSPLDLAVGPPTSQTDTLTIRPCAGLRPSWHATVGRPYRGVFLTGPFYMTPCTMLV